jgi:hypothetical protein
MRQALGRSLIRAAFSIRFIHILYETATTAERLVYR